MHSTYSKVYIHSFWGLCKTNKYFQCAGSILFGSRRNIWLTRIRILLERKSINRLIISVNLIFFDFLILILLAFLANQPSDKNPGHWNSQYILVGANFVLPSMFIYLKLILILSELVLSRCFPGLSDDSRKIGKFKLNGTKEKV